MPLPLCLAVACTLSQTPQADPASRPTAYMVGYSHLDTEWCWTYRHSILDCIPKTLHDNFALFEKYPDYVFNWTGAKRYRFMKEYYPADYEKLKAYVAQGRWAVTGSGWDECDANVPAPESIIRQVLYSNRFFQREFGKTSNNYLVPDVFGFPASLPTILAHCGLKGMSTCKLTYGAGAAVPIPFNVGNWVGPDDSSIVAALNCQSYHTEVREDPSNSKILAARIADEKTKSGLALDYTYYGTGDEGGAPDPESVRLVEEAKKSAGPVRIVAGTADQMFDELTSAQRAALPAYQGDLLLTQHSAGTATSGASMKRLNHDNELQADAAERAAVSAQLLTGAPYPQAQLTDAWERFLGGQMHDILPGTSIPQAYTFAWNDQFIALNESADVLRTAVRDIAARMDTRAKGAPVVVYNPLSFDREDLVEMSVPAEFGTAHVVGPDGKETPSQVTAGKILFRAKVPSLGFAAYDIQPGPAKTSGSHLKVSRSSLENERYRVRIDANGDIAEVFDKLAKREILSSPARLAFMFQKPVKHPAWNMEWKDQQRPPVGFVDGPAKVSILEEGPVRVTLRIERDAQGSHFVQDVSLASGNAGNRLEFRDAIDWRSRECSLKATFPLTVSNPNATYNWEVGTVERGNDNEKLYEAPSHRWFDLTTPDRSYGVSILNVAKYGSDKPDDHTLRLTLLYTPGVTDNFQHQGTGDWGHHDISYALEGHSGDWREGKTQDEAARLNQPLIAYAESPHPGPLGRSFAVARIDSSHVRIAAMKKAEDSDETIVRLFEMNGQPAPAVRVNFNRPVLSVHEVDGQEHPLSGSAVKVDGHGVVLDMSPYHPRAIAVRFRPLESPSPENVAVTLPFNEDVAAERAKTDGRFDGDGRAIPKELLPKSIQSGGMTFALAALGGPNAVACSGQKVSFRPSRNHRTLYFLTAASEGDRDAAFTVGNKLQRLRIQAWNGLIGQCDARIWDGAKEDERTSGWTHPLLGIAPGYVKASPIAWYADHLRLPDGSDDAYHFCYLFRYALDVPARESNLTLPNDPHIKILSAILASDRQ